MSDSARLIHGDCIEALPGMDDESINAAFGHWLAGFEDVRSYRGRG